MNKDFWKDKTVILTGHTGFKGGWLAHWLGLLGAKVVGISLENNEENSFFSQTKLSEDIICICQDIRDRSELGKIFQTYNPDIVFHLAAQSLVRYSYQNPIETYETNVIGTLNILESIKECQKKISAVIVSSDKCYKDQNWHWGYRENDTLSGHDPYSSSKASLEILVKSYVDSYFNNNKINAKFIATARAGNVIGGGDWAKDRLVPDIIRSINDNKTLKIRYPNAVRPWQHVLEPLNGYIILAETLYNRGADFVGPYNFGPLNDSTKSVTELIENVKLQYKNKNLNIILEETDLHETNLLKLDISKSLDKLQWSPKWNFSKTVFHTIEWYKRYYTKSNLKDFTYKQISEFSK